MHVPLLDLRAQYEQIRHEVEPAILRLCAAQQFVLGAEVEAFESEVSRYVRARHAIGCASGTDALVLALMACDVRPGDEVVVPSFTFVATAGAVALREAYPVFVDIDPGTFNLDARMLEDAITSRTRAIIPVDLFGQCADMTTILDIAGRRGVPVIEDAAQSIGAEHRGRRAGEMATLTTFSFYPSKNLGAFGDAGLVTTQDDELAAQLRKLRVHGESSRYVHECVGTNSRLDALQAAVLRIKLRHLDDWTRRRQAHAADYAARFEDQGLTELVRLPPVDTSSTRHVFNQFTVRVRERDALRAFLADHGIGSGVYYPIPLHQQNCFASLVSAKHALPHTERAASEVLSLPLYPEMTEGQRAAVVDHVARFYAQR